MEHFSPDKIRDLVVGLITLILSVTVHEFGHAFVADKLGDRTPRNQGRVTLNPVAHADPIGTLLLPAVFMFFYGRIGFGWGRPVQVNTLSFTRKLTRRTSHMLVAAAGPTMNIMFAVLISLVWLLLTRTQVLDYQNHTHVLIGRAIQNAILLNFVLAIFNLIPAPPLDGGTVLPGLLPDRAQPAYAEYAKYGMFVVLAFFLIPTLGRLIYWPAEGLYSIWAVKVLGLPGIVG